MENTTEEEKTAIMSKWITENSSLPMDEIIHKLENDGFFTHFEKYNIVWTIGVIMGKQRVVSALIDHLLTITSMEDTCID